MRNGLSQCAAKSRAWWRPSRRSHYLLPPACLLRHLPLPRWPPVRVQVPGLVGAGLVQLAARVPGEALVVVPGLLGAGPALLLRLEARSLG